LIDGGIRLKELGSTFT